VVIWGLVSPSTLGAAAAAALAYTSQSFGWFYLWVVLGVVVFCLFLAASRYGNMQLGAEDEEPEFSIVTWFAHLGPARAGRLLAVAVDARRGMVYFQAFPDILDEAEAAALIAPGDAARLIGGRAAILVGSGAAAVADAVRAAGGQAEAVLPDLQPHAASLALMAPGLVPAKPLMPLYLRPPDARPQDDKSLPRAAP
jgi:hypothetical protein